MKKLLRLRVLGAGGAVAAAVMLGGGARDPNGHLDPGALLQVTEARAAESTAIQLSRLVITKQTYADMIRQMSAGMMQGAENAGRALPAGFAEKISTIVQEALPYEEILQINAKIYSARFSDQELGEVIAFYKTATGAKMIRELPGIMGESGKIVGELIPKRLPALMKKHGLTP